MGLTLQTIRTSLCLFFFVLASTPLYSEQSVPDVHQKIQGLLHEIDTFGAEQFDPCKVDAVKNKGVCKVEELILWTGYLPPPTAKDFKPNQYSLNSTPAGKYIEKALEKIKAEIKPAKLDWDQELPVWERVSAAYVKHLLKHQTQVSVYIGKEGREKSVFCRIELPLLLKSSAGIDVVIETPASLQQYDDKLITAANQWPCGSAANQARADTEEDKKRGTGAEGYFAKKIKSINLSDPVESWKALLASIRSNPILSRIDLSKVVHLKSNTFDFHSKVNMAGKHLDFSGSLMINPQAANNDLFMKMEANLTSGKLSVGALQTSDARLVVVVANVSGKKQLHVKITPEITIKGKKLPLSIGMVKSLTDKSVSYDFDLGEPVSLTELIPAISHVSFLKNAQVGDIKLVNNHFLIKSEVNKKGVTVDLGTDASISVVADNLTVSDVFPRLSSIHAFSALAVEKIDLNTDHIEVEVELNGQKVDLVSHIGKEKSDKYIALYLDKLDAATIIPAAKGHLINSIELDKVLLILQSADTPAHTVSVSELPGDLGKLSGLSGQDDLDLLPGLNIAAQINASRSRQLSKIFKTIGVTGNRFPVRGTLPVSAFKSMSGKGSSQGGDSSSAGKHGFLSGLALNIKLPAPKFPAASKFVDVKGPVQLVINGITDDKSNFWNRLPKSLAKRKPTDGIDMSIQFEVELKGININEKLDALIDVGVGDSKNLSLFVISEGKWKKPFGIPELTLNSGGFEFSLSSKGGKRGELAFFGTANLGQHNDIEVSADFISNKGKFALNYFELDGKFNLKDIPGGSHIPHAEKYELDEIKLSAHGVEARTVFSGYKVDAFLFDAGNENWVFAIDQKNFKFAELLPAIKKIKPLDNIVLANAAVVITKNGLIGSHEDMPVIAQDLFRDILGDSSVNLNIPAGIGLIATFDEHHMGEVGEGLKRIGVHDDAILMGEITGVFQGNPGIQISLVMEQAGKAHGLPTKVISVPGGVTPQFFIQWSGAEFYVGAGLGLDVKVGKDTLHLDSKIELDFGVKGVGIDILGEMDGTWHNPFGIKGVSLSDLKMKVGINDVGEVLIGFAGHDKIGKEDIKLATEIKILLEAAMPDGVAFSGSMNNLGVPAMVDIAETILGVEGQIPVSAIPFFEIHDAVLAFATPGASDPQLGLVSGGFAVNGEFFFMNRELGQISGAANLTNGLTFNGNISDIDLEVFKFTNNKLDMALNLHPKFIITSDIKIIGVEQTVNLDLEPPHLEFDLEEKLGHFGDANLRVRLDGFDLAKGTYFKHSDISVIGQFKSTLIPWMKDQIRQGITELKDSATAKLNANLAALKVAEAKVDKINDKIKKARAANERAKSRGKAKLNKAEARASTLKRSYEHARNESKNCGDRWTHWACTDYWKIKAGSDYVLYKAAIDILEAIKAAEAAAYDYDPRVVALIAERDIELAALSIAEGVVKAARDAEKFVLAKLEHVLEAYLDHIPFEIDQAIIIGDLRDMLKNDAPLILDMKFKMFGTPMREYFAIKVADPAFDLVSFALLPALAMDKMTENALKKVNPKIANWVHSHIATKLVKAEAMVRQQVQAQEKKYAKILKSFETGGEKYRKAYAKHSEQQLAHISKTQISDLFGSSQLFKNTYLAVGHSKLCLGVADNGIDVIQENCKNISAERWSTLPNGDGYVRLKNKGLCLKARNMKVSEENPLMLAQCNKQDVHEQWKVISTDGFYNKIVNRYSQKCLHFDKENANPKTAKAVWTSCIGADSQTFRELKDAERPTWHAIKSMLKAKNGSCLSIKGRSQLLSQARLFKQIAAGKLSQREYKTITKSGGDGLYAELCQPGEDRFNYVEDVNGDIKLVHENTGWCVHPKPGRSSKLALAPCDRGKDMMWRLSKARGNAWSLRNTYHNRCLVLPAIKKGHPKYKQAYLARCQKDTSQMFDFVK